MKDKKIISSSPYLTYLYAFLILFTFGIGIGFLRNNLTNSSQNKVVIDTPLISEDENQKVIEKDINSEIKIKSSNNSP